MPMNDLGPTVGRFISKNFLYDEEKKVDHNTSLLGSGIIDSTGVLELITFLETTYQVKFKDSELIAENFDSIEKITRFVEAKLSNSSS